VRPFVYWAWIERFAMKALIFANGKPKQGAMVRRSLAEGDGALVVAADGGARIAWELGLKPQLVIGDMDSLSEKELLKLESDGTKILRYPTDKNETDLELALLYAAEQGADWIRVLGAIGGRFDQMLANVYLLALPALEHVDIALVARKQMIRLLRAGEHELKGQVGDTISLIPISGDVRVSTKQLKYPLRNETLHFGPARGISNVMEQSSAFVSIAEGVLIMVHTEGKA
jgi:thiamine pyrophosphokinase